MATEKRKNKPSRGAHRKPIDWGEIGRAADCQCTDEEIAHITKISRMTLSKWCKSDTGYTFKEFLERHRISGKASLRRLMWEKANGRPTELLRDNDGKLVLNEKSKPVIVNYGFAPDTGMQIFLAKNWLGMADKQELSTPKDNPLQVEIDGKQKLINAINRLAARVGETKDSLGT